MAHTRERFFGESRRVPNVAADDLSTGQNTRGRHLVDEASEAGEHSAPGSRFVATTRDEHPIDGSRIVRAGVREKRASQETCSAGE